LLWYGPSILKVYQRLGVYTARILQGARPADLPVEQPTTFALVVNAKTAKELQLTIPEAVLAIANEVIR
jgi:putative ABC transport system substrate-binding protein